MSGWAKTKRVGTPQRLKVYNREAEGIRWDEANENIRNNMYDWRKMIYPRLSTLGFQQCYNISRGKVL